MKIVYVNKESFELAKKRAIEMIREMNKEHHMYNENKEQVLPLMFDDDEVQELLQVLFEVPSIEVLTIAEVYGDVRIDDFDDDELYNEFERWAEENSLGYGPIDVNLSNVFSFLLDEARAAFEKEIKSTSIYIEYEQYKSLIKELSAHIYVNESDEFYSDTVCCTGRPPKEAANYIAKKAFGKNSIYEAFQEDQEEFLSIEFSKEIFSKENKDPYYSIVEFVNDVYSKAQERVKAMKLLND